MGTMGTLAVIAMALLPSLALAQPLSQYKLAGPGGSCPHGYRSSGSFCVPRAGAQDVIPLPSDGVPMGLDAQRQLLFAQRQCALIHRHARGFRLAVGKCSQSQLSTSLCGIGKNPSFVTRENRGT